MTDGMSFKKKKNTFTSHVFSTSSTTPARDEDGPCLSRINQAKQRGTSSRKAFTTRNMLTAKKEEEDRQCIYLQLRRKNKKRQCREAHQVSERGGESFLVLKGSNHAGERMALYNIPEMPSPKEEAPD